MNSLTLATAAVSLVVLPCREVETDADNRPGRVVGIGRPGGR